MKLPSLTDDEKDALMQLLERCSLRAYRDVGYRLVRFRDGSLGVINASSKLLTVVGNMRDHFSVALGLGTYEDKTIAPVSLDKEEPTE